MASEADSSTNSLVSFARWDHGTLCWKTSQRSFLEEWETYSGNWPRSGMTRNGTAFRLPPLVRLTDETESSLLPTPMAHEGRLSWQARHAGARGTQKSLTTVVMEQAGRKRGEQWTGGQLSPDWTDWFMGFPTGWTALDASGTPSSRRSLA